MPLLSGRKNIGRNIEVEQEHGKPHKQAVAVALSKARGSDDLTPVGAEDPERAIALKRHEEGITKSQDKTKARDGVKCQCESSVGCGHGGGPCGNAATRDVPTIYGGYKMCRTCAEALPAEYKKGSDMKRARDIQGHEIREKLGISEAEWAKLDKAARQDKAREALRRGKDEVMPVGDVQMTEYEQGLRKHIANLKKEPQSAMRDRLIRTAQLAIEKGITREDAARLIAKAKDTELPTAVKTSNLVPMPSGEHNEVSYAPRRVAARDRGRFRKVGDDLHEATMAAKRAEMWESAKNYGNAAEFYRKAAELSGQRSEKEEYEQKARKCTAMVNKRMNDRKGATDTIAKLPLQTSGSDPADHMQRAAEYEVAGDRARALDSYRMAASGYRKAASLAKGRDELSVLQLGEAKARDGVEACQAKFAAQYSHPGAGRVKVCDSAGAALRTAVERTRAGESVSVVGKTVRPGRASDASPMPTKWEAPKEKKGPHAFVGPQSTPYCFECGESRHSPTHKSPANDEHEGFKKLEGKLSHEKGVTNPAALAASIGRKKYGAEGMAAKSAAGRVRDLAPVLVGDDFKESDHPRADNGKFGSGARNSGANKGGPDNDWSAGSPNMKRLSEGNRLSEKVDAARHALNEANKKRDTLISKQRTFIRKAGGIKKAEADPKYAEMRKQTAAAISESEKHDKAVSGLKAALSTHRSVGDAAKKSAAGRAKDAEYAAGDKVLYGNRPCTVLHVYSDTLDLKTQDGYKQLGVSVSKVRPYAKTTDSRREVQPV